MIFERATDGGGWWNKRGALDRERQAQRVQAGLTELLRTALVTRISSYQQLMQELFPLLPPLEITFKMISDDDLYRLAIFLGSAAMLLIVLYHFLEVNAVEEPEVDSKASTSSSIANVQTASIAR
ncbi:hypothetical protein BUE80_DR003441 [Diplocarpon rosae]|nr:hypothetical protein BUE80_DR003441 [Diplocarpon rosae]